MPGRDASEDVRRINEEEAALLADFAEAAHDSIIRGTWRSHGYRKLADYVSVIAPGMSTRRYKMCGMAWDMAKTLKLTKDDVIRAHVDRIVRALPTLQGLIDDGRKEQAVDFFLRLHEMTHEQITNQNRVTAPRVRFPLAVAPCPHCHKDVEVWHKNVHYVLTVPRP